MEEIGNTHGPSLQITPVENGYIISTFHGQKERGDIPEMLSSVMNGFSSGEDPAESVAKAIGSIKIKESTRRKAVEHHIAKSIEEVLKLIPEILGSMKN
jgi:hypothetical protein